MNSELIEYRDGDTVLEGFAAWQDNNDGPRPAVMVAHDWSGRRDYAKDKAEEMANLGYVGFAIDMYGKDVFGADGDVALNSSLMNPLAEHRVALRSRINAALTSIRHHHAVDARLLPEMLRRFIISCSVVGLTRSSSAAFFCTPPEACSALTISWRS